MYCIGCGEPLRVSSGHCPSCRTAVAGANFAEAISIAYGRAVVVPPVCCCCLAPRHDTDVEEFSSVNFQMDRRVTKIPIPWCLGCKRRRKVYQWLALAVLAVTGTPVYFLFEPWIGGASFFVAIIGGAIGYVVALPLLRRLFPNLQLPGHVPECDAVSGGAGARNAKLTFGNRAFAQIWRELNSGVVSKAPAMAWAEKTLPSNDQPPPRTKASQTTGVETRARVREQLQAGRPGPLSRLDFGSRPVGADAATEILRFATKTLEIGDQGLKAIDRAGESRELAFSEIESVVARKTPDDPPWSGTIFLDLIPRGNGKRPLRLLAATKANYGVLPGTGSTSHENFRRLVRHLRSKNPGVVVEPGSLAYLEEGRGFPPALPTVDELLEYDRHFAG